MTTSNNHPDIRSKMLATALVMAELANGLAGCSLTTPDPVIQELPGERRCLSLRVLSEHVRNAVQHGQPIDNEALTLAGIGRLEGYYIDKENADVVLVGRAGNSSPLHLDDLALALSLAGRGQDPYCSLDPQKEGVLRMSEVLAENVNISDANSLADFVTRLQTATGPQDVVVGGVSKSSRWARTMVYADYEMKRISQGLLEVDGVRSSLEMNLDITMERARAGKGSAAEESISRFWFHLAEDPKFMASDDMVFIRNCDVVVLTEQQCAAADGSLFDKGGEGKGAQAWAEQFSVELVGETVPECEQLEALYRLLAVARVMDLRQAAEQVGLDLSFLTDRYKPQTSAPLPISLPGLANAMTGTYEDEEKGCIYSHASIICGGVSMETNVIAKNILSNGKTIVLLDPVEELARSLRPVLGFWWAVAA